MNWWFNWDVGWLLFFATIWFRDPICREQRVRHALLI
jgi:hypothetical protein